VQIRRLTALAIVPRDFHYEMPFEVQADGPYFNLMDFFGRLGRLSRIINVGDLDFADPDKSKGTKYSIRPGTTVSAIFTATTFFTKPADVAPSSATSGAKSAVKPVGKP
jgi:Tfp pilus assembly protein PilO